MKWPNSCSLASSVFNPQAGTCGGPIDATRQGREFNIIAYGAKPCPFDSTTAIQNAINAAAGAPVILPGPDPLYPSISTGKWCIAAPLTSYAISTTGAYVAGLRLEGSGHGGTQLLMLSGWTLNPTATFQGYTVYPAPAMVDIQGTPTPLVAGAGFKQGGDISNIEFSTYGCESLPATGEPACSPVTAPNWITGSYDGVSAISIEGIWNLIIHDDTFEWMSGSNVIAPNRLDISADGDNDQSFGTHIEANRMLYGAGWGVKLGQNVSYTKIDNANLIENNALGGIYITSLDNWVEGNSIDSNGCAQYYLSGSAGSPVSCSSNPIGPGIYIGRDFGSAAPGPYNDSIIKNELDSNAQAAIYIDSVNNLTAWNNQGFFHATSYHYNNTFPGPTQEPPKQMWMLGGDAATNVTIINDLLRSDYYTTSGIPATSPAQGPNALLDPEVTAINLAYPNTSKLTAMANSFMSSSNAGNLTAYAQGAGAIWGAPVISSNSVSSWPLVAQGVGYSTAPTLYVVGGDSAFQKPTLLTLTESNGALATCTVVQGGGPYNRMPMTLVQDSEGGSGSGGAITLTLSGSPGTYTVPSGGCTIASAGSGYSRPIAGVAPVGSDQPQVTATATIGAHRIKMSTGGNYGTYTPGALAPTGYSVALSDPTGTGFNGAPVFAPVNLNPIGQSPNLVWEIVAVKILMGQHGYNFQSLGSATVSFTPAPTCSGCSAATASVIAGYMLAPNLTVTHAGTIDAGTTPWIVATNTAYPSVNTNGNSINDGGVVVTSPTAALPPTNSLTLDTSHKDITFVRTAGNTLSMYCGPLNANGLPTQPCYLNIFKSNDGTNSQYLQFDMQPSLIQILSSGAGSPGAAGLEIGTTNSNSFEVIVNNSAQWIANSLGAWTPGSSSNTATLGDTAHPVNGGAIFGPSAPLAFYNGASIDAGVSRGGVDQVNVGNGTAGDASGKIDATTYITPSGNGFTGTKTAGSCVLTFSGGIVISVSGC